VTLESYFDEDNCFQIYSGRHPQRQARDRAFRSIVVMAERAASRAMLTRGFKAEDFSNRRSGRLDLEPWSTPCNMPHPTNSRSMSRRE